MRIADYAERLAKWVEEHPYEDITPSRLAEEVQITTDQASKWLSQSLNMSGKGTPNVYKKFVGKMERVAFGTYQYKSRKKPPVPKPIDVRDIEAGSLFELITVRDNGVAILMDDNNVLYKATLTVVDA